MPATGTQLIEEKPEDEGIGRKTFKTTSSLFIGKAITLLVTGIAFIVVARLMGPSTFGLLTFALGYSSLIGATNHFGVGTYFNKHVAEAMHNKEYEKLADQLKAGLTVLIPASFGFAALGVAISGVLVGTVFSGVGITVPELELAGFMVSFNMIFAGTYVALVGFSRGGLASIANVLSNVVTAVLVIGLVVLGYGVVGALWGYIIGDVAGVASSLYYIYRTLGKYTKYRGKMPDRAALRHVLKFSLPMGTINALNFGVQSFGTVFLGLFVLSSVLGNYGTGIRGLNLLSVFYGTLLTVLLSAFSWSIIISKTTSDKQHVSRTYNKLLFYSMLATLPLMAFIGVFAKPLIDLLLTTAYAQAPLFLDLIIAGTALGLIGQYTSSLVTAGGYVVRSLKIVAITAVGEVASLVILTPLYGAVGTIAALFFVGNLIPDILYVQAAIKLLGVKFEYKRLLLLAGATLVLLAILIAALLVPEFALKLVLGIAITLFVYPVILVFMRVIDHDDVDEFHKATDRVAFLGPIISPMLRYITALLQISGVRQ